MRTFLLAVVIEIPVVAGGCHSNICGLHNSLDLVPLAGHIIYRASDTYPPRRSLGVVTLGYDLTAYIHQIIPAPVAHQQIGNHVTTLPFGYSSGIHLNHWIGLVQICGFSVCRWVQADTFHAYMSQQFVHLLRFDMIAVLQPESPQVDQGCNRYVERSAGQTMYILRRAVHLYKICIRHTIRTAIDPADSRCGIEHTHRDVEISECGADRVMQVIRTLVPNSIIRAEHAPLVSMIRRLGLVGNE